MNNKIDHSLEISRRNFKTLLKRHFFRNTFFSLLFFFLNAVSQIFKTTSPLILSINLLSIYPVLCDSLTIQQSPSSKNTHIKTKMFLFSSPHLTRIYLVMVFSYICVSIYVYIYIYIYIYMRMYMHMCIYVCVCRCLYLFHYFIIIIIIQFSLLIYLSVYFIFYFPFFCFSFLLLLLSSFLLFLYSNKNQHTYFYEKCYY